MHQESKAEEGMTWHKTRPQSTADGWAWWPLSHFQVGPASQACQSPTLPAPCAWSLMSCDCLLEILHFIFEFVFLQMKSNKTMEHVPMAWSLGPQEGSSPSASPDGLVATDSSTSWRLRPCPASPSWPWTELLLSLGTRRVRAELMCLTLSWDRAHTPGWAPHPGLTAPECIRQVTWLLTHPWSRYQVPLNAEIAIPGVSPTSSCWGQWRDLVGREDWLPSS